MTTFRILTLYWLFFDLLCEKYYPEAVLVSTILLLFLLYFELYFSYIVSILRISVLFFFFYLPGEAAMRNGRKILIRRGFWIIRRNCFCFCYPYCSIYRKLTEMKQIVEFYFDISDLVLCFSLSGEMEAVMAVVSVNRYHYFIYHRSLNIVFCLFFLIVLLFCIGKTENEIWKFIKERRRYFNNFFLLFFLF